MSTVIHENPFYHSSIRRTTEVVGTLLDNLSIVRPGDKRIRVPLSYASKRHWVYRLREDFDQTRKEQEERSIHNRVVLPRITYMLSGFRYDASRMVNPTSKVKREVELPDGEEIRKWQFYPTPYNVSFRVTAFAKNMDDLMQITEQILPYFRPSITLRVAEIGEKSSGLEVYNDVVITKEGDPVFTDSYIEGFDRGDLVTVEFDLMAQTHIWGPIREQKIILKSIVDLDSLSPWARLQRVEVEAAPGETENRDNSTTTITDLV